MFELELIEIQYHILPCLTHVNPSRLFFVLELFEFSFLIFVLAIIITVLVVVVMVVHRTEVDVPVVVALVADVAEHHVKKVAYVVTDVAEVRSVLKRVVVYVYVETGPVEIVVHVIIALLLLVTRSDLPSVDLVPHSVHNRTHRTRRMALQVVFLSVENYVAQVTRCTRLRVRGRAERIGITVYYYVVDVRVYDYLVVRTVYGQTRYRLVYHQRSVTGVKVVNVLTLRYHYHVTMMILVLHL